MAKNFRPVFLITNWIATDLTTIDRARGFLEAVELSETWASEMGKRAFILDRG
jgi:hypothetical protein